MRYPSNLTDKQWRNIPSWLPKPHTKERLRSVCRWSVVNAILSVSRTGSAWRDLPKALPCQNTAQQESGLRSLLPVDAGTGGPRRYDGGRKVSGRKRHLIVDTMAWLLAVVVFAADWPDQNGVFRVPQALRLADTLPQT
jgi:putative transposase